MGGAAYMATSDSAIQLYANELLGYHGLCLFVFCNLFYLGYLIYSSIYAAIGAAVDNETDTQQFIFPIILPLMLAIYVGFFSVFNKPTWSYSRGVFFISFDLAHCDDDAFARWHRGRRCPYLGGGSIYFTIDYYFYRYRMVGCKIYRVGILMYGKKPSYKDLFKWLKY